MKENSELLAQQKPTIELVTPRTRNGEPIICPPNCMPNCPPVCPPNTRPCQPDIRPEICQPIGGFPRPPIRDPRPN